MRRGTLMVLAFFACATVASAADFTGTWNGALSGQNKCNGTKPPIVVDVTASFTQSGDAVFGSLLIVSRSECDGLSHTYVSQLSGSVSGATLSAPVIVDRSSGQFTATVSGDSMTARLNLTDPLDLNGTLTRTSSQPPSSDFSGKYSGTFNGVIIPCLKLAPVSYSGAMSGSLVQAGSTLTGPIMVTGLKRDRTDQSGNCTLVDDPPSTFQFTFQLNGNTLTGFVNDPSGSGGAFTGTLSGNTLTCNAIISNPGESFMFTLTRTSSGTPIAISSFAARPSAITPGEPSTLAWTTVGASSVSIDNGIGRVAVSGALTVSPQQTTTYTLTASGPGGSATATTAVTVTGGGPRVVIGTRPAGMLEEAGATATDSFNITNTGNAPANVRLSTTGSFFTAAPLSFTLRAGQTQVIGIQASAQPAGTYDGAINVSGDGLPATGVDVRVRLFVAAPPAAPVNPQADSPRVEVSNPAGQNPSGSVSFTNSGSATVQGIAVADVPWILPQTDPVTIAPGQSQPVAFTIDRSKRPDGDSPLGGAAGTISLVYFAFGASKGTVVNATPSSHTSRVSVSVLDLSKPNVAPGTPAALGAGEVAFFLTNLPSIAGISAGDLFLSNTGATAMSNVKIFQLPSASAAALPLLPSNLAVSFPSIARTVFSAESGLSLQVRTPQPENMSVGDLSTLIKSGYAYSASVPVLRSDRGAGSGEKLVLPGIEQTTANSSVIFLQELQGTQATAQVQFLDSAGATLGSPQSQTIAPFAAVTVSTTPANARAVVITNTSSAASSINAFARVVNAGSNDSWMVVDSSKAATTSSNEFIVPVLPIPGAATAAVDLFATNTSANSVTVTMDQVPAAVVKRRAVGASGAQPRPESTSTVRSMETVSIPINGLSAGFVRLSAPIGSLHVNGRVTATVFKGSGAMGSGLPAIPSTAAMATGQSKRFTGVDDASGTTTATFRSSLMLIDPSEAAIRVRVTLRFTYSAGTSTTAEATAARDFSLAGGQAIFINNLARTMIGPQRDALGDLHNMQVDITVIDGGGSVIPVIEAVDNASGDIVVRTD